jgi:hypothetical protein
MEWIQADKIRALVDIVKRAKPMPGSEPRNPLIRARDELVELAGRWPTAERMEIIATLVSAVASIEMTIEKAKRPAG